MTVHRMAALVGLFSFTLVFSFIPMDVRAEDEEQDVSQPLVRVERTMTRTQDFIVIHGEKIKKNLNKKIETLSLLAKIDGKVEPIPFQVDEINEEGEWVLPQFPPYLEKTSYKVDKDDDDGHLDENDELVFMIKDAGDRIIESEYPEGTQEVDEIVLVDQVDDSRAWVYLCSFSSAPPLSDKDYANYVFPDNQVVTTNYRLGFSLDLPISWDHLSFRGEPNMVDRLKVRISVKMMGMTFDWDESQIFSNVSAYKDGPVRVVRRVRSGIRLNRILKTPSIGSETIYYENAIIIPFRLRIPINTGWVKKVFGLEVKVRAGVDLQNLHGWQLLPDVDPRWLNIDGKMDEIEESVKGEGSTWWVLSGEPGAFFVRLILDRKPDGSHQESPVETNFFYIDDDTADHPPEFVPGQSPNPGWWITRLEEIPKGTFYFYITGYIINDYQLGMEGNLLNIIDKPVEVIMN